MKSLLIFIIFTGIGFGVIFLFFDHKTSSSPSSPKLTKITPTAEFSINKAPTNSVKGALTELSGNILWQSRTATNAAQITDKREIQQGEALVTQNNSQATLTFPDLIIRIDSDTKLNIIQTLPRSFVFEQPIGTVQYNVSNTLPLSVRSLPLLVSTTKAIFSLTVDELGRITIKVDKGDITTAYNDSNNFSTVEKTMEGQIFIFDTNSLTSRIR